VTCSLHQFMKIRLWTILALTTIAILHANPAQAQATRTWVSGVGDDANPCSRTAPCKTFAGAISKTAPGGEINVLDPGGFGAVTITKSISITSVGFEAGVLVSGTNGIVVQVADTDKVLLGDSTSKGWGQVWTGSRLSEEEKQLFVDALSGVSPETASISSALRTPERWWKIRRSSTT
jgi:hypothetical protein